MDRVVHDALAAVEERHWWWRTRREILSDVIAHYAPEGELRVAEVGCGHGGNLAMLAQFGHVLGAEADPQVFAVLRETRGDSYSVIQHQIPQPLPQRCHVLGLFDVLEHIEDDAAAMRWVAQSLEPGGIAVLTVPALQFLWSELDTAAKHFRRYTEGDLRRIIPPTLELEHISYFNSLLFVPIAAVRTAMRLLPRGLQPSAAQLDLPPAPINWLLHRIFALERRIVVRGHLPVGVSVVLVLRRRSVTA